MKKRLINIMPMAGDGLRFKKAGYKTPKPLININGEPMFMRSAKCMPKADLWIFLIKKELLNDYQLENKINKNFKNNKIIPIKNTTEGQAATCFMAKEYLKENDQIFVSSCDNYFEINQDDYLNKSNKHDVIIFTTNSNKIHIDNPNLFGWVKNNDSGEIKISCKKKISSDPSKDRIIVGSFFFKNLDSFIKPIKSLFEKKIKINNEYYLDMAIIEATILGLNVGELIVKNYKSWGSHKELENWKNDNL